MILAKNWSKTTHRDYQLNQLLTRAKYPKGLASVKPVMGTSQTGHASAAGDEVHQQVNSKNQAS
jgi:hypothetical protein